MEDVYKLLNNNIKWNQAAKRPKTSCCRKIMSEVNIDDSVKMYLRISEKCLADCRRRVKLAKEWRRGTKKPKQTHKRQFKAGCQHSQKIRGQGNAVLTLSKRNLGLMKVRKSLIIQRAWVLHIRHLRIRQAITRSLADQARTIRIPVHMVETINKLTKTSRTLLQQLAELQAEIAEAMGFNKSWKYKK